MYQTLLVELEKVNFIQGLGFPQVFPQGGQEESHHLNLLKNGEFT